MLEEMTFQSTANSRKPLLQKADICGNAFDHNNLGHCQKEQLLLPLSRLPQVTMLQ
eukprot:Gb_37525 [translate_table: standard]